MKITHCFFLKQLKLGTIAKLSMTLLKVLIVLSALLVASSYGHSQRVGGRGRAPRKWTTAGRDRTSMHSDRLARINHHVPEEKYRLDEVPCRGAIMPPEK